MDWHTVKAGLRVYLDQYARDHAHPMTRLTHLVGIPLIVAAFPMAPFRPLRAAGMFTAGWALQFLGHYGYEKKSPSFFSDPRYLLVGPVWVLIEALQLLGIEVLTEAPPPQSSSPLN
jgi:uncharacterized membrane protein YGL010W